MESQLDNDLKSAIIDWFDDKEFTKKKITQMSDEDLKPSIIELLRSKHISKFRDTHGTPKVLRRILVILRPD